MNGRRRAVTAGWQLCAGSSPARLRGLGSGLGGVELDHELLGPRLDARLEVPPQILTRDGQLVRGRRGSIVTRVTVESQPPYKRT